MITSKFLPQGLDCWECANALNDTDCLNKGKLVTCRLNEVSYCS